MKVSKQFIRDFAQLANKYQWTLDDIEEVKEHTRLHPEIMKRYWSILAKAFRDGYDGETPLDVWCVVRQLSDPWVELRELEKS